MAYAVPSGRFLIAIERKIALKMYPITVMTDGKGTVKPFAYFRAQAHVTSRIPANNKKIHCIIIILLKKIAPYLYLLNDLTIKK
jgi:hypothetical protein